MKTASAIICLIAALLGLATSLFTLLTGGTASLFGATGAQEMVNFGWVGLTASLLLIITAALTFKSKGNTPPILSALLAFIGIIFGGTFTAFALVLALAGGFIGAIAPEAKTTPVGVKGWSWGVFFLGFIWALFNRVWIGLLTLVPGFGLLMLVILGIKGREWAWNARSWTSVEDFQRNQSRWNRWGWGIAAFLFIFGVIGGIVIPQYEQYEQYKQYDRNKQDQAIMRDNQTADNKVKNAGGNGAAASARETTTVTPPPLSIPTAMQALFSNFQKNPQHSDQGISVMPGQIRPRWAFPLAITPYAPHPGIPETILLYQNSSIRHAADAYQAASGAVGAAIFSWEGHRWHLLWNAPLITRMGDFGRIQAPHIVSIGHNRPGFLFAGGTLNQGITSGYRELMAPVNHRIRVVWKMMDFEGSDIGQCGSGAYSPCYHFHSRLQISKKVGSPWYLLKIVTKGTKLENDFTSLVTADSINLCRFQQKKYVCKTY